MTTSEKMEQDIAYLRENMEKLNRTWQIKDTVIPVRNTPFSRLKWLVKRCVRKATYWLIRPYWNQQVEFNRTVSAALADVYRLQSTLTDSSGLATALSPDPMAQMEGPRVFQLVSMLAYGDAVGNEVVAFKKTLQENGYATEIYAKYIADKIPAGMARPYEGMPQLRKEDLVIYHFASECSISRDIKNFPCKVILRYHNVTPPKFFHKYDANAEKATANGLRQVKQIIPYISYCLPVSEFNKRDLLSMGYTCPMTVLPILIRYEDYEQTPDLEVVRKYSDGVTNVLFVGRVAPNKKFEDVISAFARYKKKYDPTARLFLVGSYQEKDAYYRFLQKHIKKLGVKDVIFPGHISFAAILAYYKVASVFLCMSEHEGFCVPLVEAMYFGIPIVAYDSSAVGDTLGGAGILLKNKNCDAAADGVERALQETAKYKNMERKRIDQFAGDKILSVLISEIMKALAENNKASKQ